MSIVRSIRCNNCNAKTLIKDILYIFGINNKEFNDIFNKLKCECAIIFTCTRCNETIMVDNKKGNQTFDLCTKCKKINNDGGMMF